MDANVITSSRVYKDFYKDKMTEISSHEDQFKPVMFTDTISLVESARDLALEQAAEVVRKSQLKTQSLQNQAV